MTIDPTRQELIDLNAPVHQHENNGATTAARDFFDGLLAEHFAFRRAGGSFEGREGFLARLASGGDRELLGLDVRPLGPSRALVTCQISMTVEGERRVYDNSRLFVRDQAGRWRLLGWANEPAA